MVSVLVRGKHQIALREVVGAGRRRPAAGFTFEEIRIKEDSRPVASRVAEPKAGLPEPPELESRHRLVRGDGERCANVLGMAALVGGVQAQRIFGRALFAGREVPTPIQVLVIQRRQQRFYLDRRAFEIGA